MEIRDKLEDIQSDSFNYCYQTKKEAYKLKLETKELIEQLS